MKDAIPFKPTVALPRLGSRTIRYLVLVVLLCWCAVFALAQLRPPAPLSDSAPLTVFAAGRAMHHVEALSQQPRSMGAPGHVAAQQYLRQEIEALGLQPEVQATTVVQHWPGATEFSVGSVQNILVRLPGTASTGAIVLDGHYDSGSNSPGAADCGSCVATLLETLRALQAGPPLQNDVIFVFADGEENGDLGAYAFITQHPWRKDVRLAINFEATGNGGPNLLYSTSPNNRRVIEGFLRASPRPAAHAFATAFDRWLPMTRIGCDLEEYMDHGIPGLGFALTGNTTGYHNRLDSTTHLSRRSLQHQGNDALALTQYFGEQDLSDLEASQDAIYFNILPQVAVYYSTAWAIPLAFGVTLIFLAVGRLGRRRLTIRGGVMGAIAFLTTAISAVLFTALLWWAIKTLNPNLQVHLIGHYRTIQYFAGLSIFAMALMVAVQVWLQQRIELCDRMAGVALVWLGLMWLTSALSPFISYLFTWPLLFYGLLLGWQLSARYRSGSWLHIAVLLLAALPGMLLLLPVIVHPTLAFMVRLEAFMPVPLLVLPTIFVVLLMGLLVPHVELLTDEVRSRWTLPSMLLLVSATVLTLATLTSGFDAEQPRPNSIAYALDGDTGNATWVSVDARLDTWTAQFFPEQSEPQDYELFPGVSVQAFTAPAPDLPLTAPEVTMLSQDIGNSANRLLRLRLTSPRRAPNLHVQFVADGIIKRATVNGEEMRLGELPTSIRDQLTFDYFNVPKDGIELTLMVQTTQPIQLVMTDTAYGLPQPLTASLQPRSAASMPSFWGLDPTYVKKTFWL
ncbi:MAG: M28 family peptidase [Cyanobacteria bacterium P01_D01_bin.14]